MAWAGVKAGRPRMVLAVRARHMTRAVRADILKVVRDTSKTTSRATRTTTRVSESKVEDPGISELSDLSKVG